MQRYLKSQTKWDQQEGVQVLISGASNTKRLGNKVEPAEENAEERLVKPAQEQAWRTTHLRRKSLGWAQCC